MNDHPDSDGADDKKLSRELKAFEAELAMLRPREDRLDRERLIFLAGQASVSGTADDRRAHLGRWAWPTSFAAMTAVAAVLFVMLFTQTADVPALPAPVIVVAPTGTDSPDTTAATSGRSRSSFGFSVSRTSRWEGLPAAGHQFRLFDHLLAEKSYLQMSKATSGDTEDTVAPEKRSILSPRSLDKFLNESAAAGSASDWPPAMPPQNPGANS